MTDEQINEHIAEHLFNLVPQKDTLDYIKNYNLVLERLLHDGNDSVISIDTQFGYNASYSSIYKKIITKNHKTLGLAICDLAIELTKKDISNTVLYTDGACRGNQFKENTGAWAYFYKSGSIQGSESGSTRNTTNNIMELTALLEGLKTLSLHPDLKKTKINVFSDSQYLINGINIWSKNWIKKLWKGVENRILWQEILELISKFKQIEFTHVAGHSGHEGNETVDKLCNTEMDKL